MRPATPSDHDNDHDRVHGFCKHCRRKVEFTIEAHTADIYQDRDHLDIKNYQGNCHDLLRCPECRGITLSTYYYSQCNDDLAPIRTTLYPASVGIPRGLPEEVEQAYVDALSVRAVSLQSYVVMLRRVLGAVGISQSARGDTLTEQVKNLAETHGIPTTVVEGIERLETPNETKGMLNRLHSSEVEQLERTTRIILDCVYNPDCYAAMAPSRGPNPNETEDLEPAPFVGAVDL